LTKTIGNLLELEHHTGLKLARANTALHLLAQKSELNLVYISTSLHTYKLHSVLKEDCIIVV